VLIAPLLARDEKLGAIGLITDDPARQFTADELRVAQTIAGQVAAAIDIGRLIDETRAQRDVAEALRRTTNALSRSLDQETVLATILQQLRHVLEYEGAAIALVDGHDLVIVGAEGISERYLGLRTPLAADSAAVQVLRRGAPLMVSRTQQSNAWAPWPEMPPIRSWLGVPMVAGEKVIGVLNFDSTTASAFAQPQAELLMIFADQAAIAVTNARLYQQAQVAAAISERERIARDLHDAVTQSIFSASLIAEALPMQLPAAPADVQHNLALLGKLTKGALAELRALLLELRPEHLTATPLDHLLTHLAEAFTGRMGTPVQVTANCDPLYKPLPAVQLGIYRIAQEALNNVAKHAQAQNVTINLVLRPGLIRLGILDDGRGFDSQMLARARLGISIMHERAAEIGADLAIDSAPGMGTQLFLVWNEAAAADR
jgi:two-component system nitrate/nitrite sensor histidine kinase NarX